LGKIESAKLVTDRYSGNYRGFAFIEMADRNEGQQAIKEVNGHEIKGRRIKVSESRTRRDKWGYPSRRSDGRDGNRG
jgi:RNA recognition motif-containing protein